jgi:TolB-like protein
MPLAPGVRLGSYIVGELLGSGGMGEVYRAHDERLRRDVAVKVLLAGHPAGESSRLWREARAAASVSHPGICQIFDVGESSSGVFIAMELLAGESLAARIGRGPMEVGEAARIAGGMLDALEAMHGRGIVHRDLKPSNVFLTAHGVKLLDFGLARASHTGASASADTATLATAAGTPQYMAPEQWSGSGDERSDLFALGAILFEMLVGTHAFPGDTIPQIYHAVISTQPPALSGSSTIAAVDGVIHRALEKRPEDRFQSAASMAAALRVAMTASETTTMATARPTTRLLVLPFRMLRPDADVGFLTFSLPDAVTASLAGLESLVVRSTLAGAKFGDAMDLVRIAGEAGVDAVVCGTLLRAGDQVRVTAQLVDTPGGTVRWSKTVQASMGDLFQLQDDLARTIVESLAIPLSGTERQRLHHDLPTSARAYELYLRANQVSHDMSMLAVARDLYRGALDEDPRYAPAWARLGRVYRVLAKYGDKPPADTLRLAEEAFNRALDLNPDLSLAHNLYTAFEVESLGRAAEAIRRLLERARTRPADPELYAGLTVACRYCGLLDASIAADRQARRIDPRIRTSVMYTHFMRGDWERAIAADNETERRFATLYALSAAGRNGEAIALAREHETASVPVTVKLVVRAVRQSIEGDLTACRQTSGELVQSSIGMDPEALHLDSRNLAHLGDADGAIALLERAVSGGFRCAHALRHDPWFARLHGLTAFEALVARAEDEQRSAERIVRELGGDRLLPAG